jgi:hypothetical protein
VQAKYQSRKEVQESRAQKKERNAIIGYNAEFSRAIV